MQNKTENILFNEILSDIGNAYFSGIGFKSLWECIQLASNREELDAAIAATIRIDELGRESLDKPEKQ
jgi:hypothetical protein